MSYTDNGSKLQPFAARFPNSTCQRCKGPIEVGDLIQRVPNAFGYRHVRCPQVATEIMAGRPGSAPGAPHPGAMVGDPAVQVVRGILAPPDAPMVKDPFAGVLPPQWEEVREHMVIDLTKINVADAEPIEWPHVPPSLISGRYTVAFPDGTWRTLRIQMPDPQRKFAPDRIIVAYLYGPNNASDYKGFAFIAEDGQVWPWKSFAGDLQIVEAAEILLKDPRKAGEAFAMKSKQCYHCGRDLTVPVSLHRGLGPICFAKLGGGL
jgi:hypothetical protein